MSAEERIKKILAAVELILKLALMVLSLNLILLSAFSALGLNGMRSAFLPGFLVSIDVMHLIYLTIKSLSIHDPSISSLLLRDLIRSCDDVLA